MSELQIHGGDADWRGADLAQQDDWRLTFDGAALEDLKKAAQETLHRDIASLKIGDFPLPTLAPTLRKIRDVVVDGRGFALLHGLPVDIWPRAVTARVFWAIGLHLGTPVVQNRDGHLLGHVKDLGGDAESPTQRGYQSAAELPFHTDVGAEVVGLLCLKPAKAGGLSSVVSAAALWNEILRQRPDLAAVLAAPYPRDRRGDVAEGQADWYAMPIFMPAGARMTTAYVRRFIQSGQRHADAPRLSPAQVEAMDFLDSLAYDPAFKLDMDFQAGDVQLVNNLITLHTRTAYEDFDQPEHRRHLFRLWLSIPDGWPLPNSLYARYGADPATGRPLGINLPPTVLANAPLDTDNLIS